MTADAEIVIGIRSDGTGARVIRRELDGVATSGDKATKSTDNLDKGMKNLNRTAALLKTALLGVVATLGAREFVRFSDKLTTMQTQLKNVTSSTDEYNKRFNDLYAITLKTGDALDGLVSNYVRLNTSLPDAIRNTTDLTKVTELLSKGFTASGTSAQAANAVMTQLTQGLAGNFANAAQEINSLIEGAPLLAKTIAEQLGGKAATDLKRFAEQGKLTSESFLKALLDAESAINSYELPPTIERSVQRIKNEFMLLASESDTMKGASLLLSRALDGLAASLGTILNIIGVAVASTLPLLILQIGTTLPVAVTSLTAAFAALNAVIAANPIAFVTTAITAATTAFFLFREEIFETLRDVDVFGVRITDVFFTIKNTAIEVFSSLVTTISAPFVALLDVFKATIGQLKRAANTLPKINFELTADEERLSSKSIIDIISDRTSATVSSNANLFERITQATNEDIAQFGTTSGRVNIPTIDKPQVSVADEIISANEEAEKLSKTFGEDIPSAVEGLVEHIGTDFVDTLEGAFKKSGDGFDGFVYEMQSSFTGFMNNIAQMAARPIMMNIVGAVSGGMTGMSAGNVSAGGISSILGSGSSGGGGFSLGNLGSLASSGFSALTSGLGAPIFGAGSMIGGGINSIGSALGLTNANFIGPMMPGTSSLASAFTPAAGIAGFAGNFLGDLIFGGDSGIGSSLGGAAGGIAGTAIGANMGTILGFAGGPAGALIGALAGNALGGLFGGASVPSDAADIGLTLNNGQLTRVSATSDEASSERLQQLDSIQNTLSQTLGSLQSALGVSISSESGFYIGATRREPGISKTRQGGYKEFGSLEDAVNYTFNTVLANADISGASSEFEARFREIFSSGGTLEENINSVIELKSIMDLIASFDTVADSTNPLQAALDSLDAQFSQLTAQATALGLPVANLTTAYEKQREALISDTLQPFQDFLDAQLLSDVSSLSTADKLGMARGAFDENLAAINTGDYSNIDALTTQASQLLQIGRDVFASGEGFTALESFVRQSIVGVGEGLGGEGALNGDIGQDIVISNAEQTSILQQMALAVQELQEENRKLRKSMERVGNLLVVQA